MKPEVLMDRLLGGTFANVAFVDARRLLEALGFEELRVKGSHHVYGRVGIAEQLNLPVAVARPSPTRCASS